MARYLVATLATGLLATNAALAESVRVRTAEHDGFTRIVVDFTTRREWTLAAVEGDQVLRIQDGMPSYDLSDAFRRITDRRVRGLSDDGNGGLRVGLNCDCVVQTTTRANGGLILDVMDRDVTAGPPVWAWMDVPPPVLLPGNLTSALNNASAPKDANDRQNELRREVSAQLARGVAQGLVELDPERPMDDRGSAPDPAPGHVSITTAADRDRTMAPENAEVACIGPEALDVASWKPEGWPDRWIGGSFAALTDAADRPDPNALKTRVRHLLFLGFGAEAAQMLHAAEASAVIVPDAGVMAEMAALTDGPADAPLLSGQAACAGPGIVWALLADGRSFPRTAGVEGLLTEFSRLPSHLRTNLGPRLVAELIALQMPNIAAEVDAAVKRGNPPADAKTAMMTARIATEDGRPEDARESAQAVIKARSPDAVEAMRLMLEQAERYPDLVSPDLPDQALALAFEAESPEREELTLATIRLMAGKGDIAGGFGELLRLRDATDETDIQDADVVTRLHGALNDTPSDDGFVRLAAQSVRDWPPVDDEELRVARAKRLTDLGLHRIARSVLSGFDAPPGRAERLILARIQLNDDDPDLAESYLAGLEGPDVVSLKALIEEARAAQQAIAAEPLPVDVQNPATARRELLDGSRAIRAEVEALLGQR